MEHAKTRHPLSGSTGRQVREAIRAGAWTGQTMGLGLGHVQANLAILPQDWAGEFEDFCRANPRPCPLLEVTAPGATEFRRAAPGSDVRTDLASYEIYEHGMRVGTRRDLLDRHRAHHVSFLLGCSHSLDPVLLAAGIELHHLARADARIPIYVSEIACTPVGRFSGQVVVSMRPIKRHQLDRVVALSADYPVSHGGPLHVGDPGRIGIDLARTAWGRYAPMQADEVPVFWACGITPQAVAMASRVPEMMTHTAGHMLVTDYRMEDFKGRTAFC